jgi:hypothetical protein
LVLNRVLPRAAVRSVGTNSQPARAPTVVVQSFVRRARHVLLRTGLTINRPARQPDVGVCGVGAPHVDRMWPAELGRGPLPRPQSTISRSSTTRPSWESRAPMRMPAVTNLMLSAHRGVASRAARAFALVASVQAADRATLGHTHREIRDGCKIPARHDALLVSPLIRWFAIDPTRYQLRGSGTEPRLASNRGGPSSRLPGEGGPDVNRNSEAVTTPKEDAQSASIVRLGKGRPTCLDSGLLDGVAPDLGDMPAGRFW